jgi:hypothetical protein
MNNERPIERLLRDTAKARRAQAGPEPALHPANRRLLQQEVRRQFGSVALRAVGPARSFWRPRLAWGAASFLVVGLAAIFIHSGYQESKVGNLALNRDEASELSAPSMPAPPAPAETRARDAGVEFESAGSLASSPSPLLAGEKDFAARRLLDESKQAASLAYDKDVETARAKKAEAGNPKASQELFADGSAQSPPPAAAALADPAAETSTGDSGLDVTHDVTDRKQGAALESYLAKGSAAKPEKAKTGGFAAAADSVSSVASRATSANQTTVGDFARSERQTGDAPAASSNSQAMIANFRQSAVGGEQARILQNFVLEQEGNLVVVRDEDGSVYKGEVQMPAAAAMGAGARMASEPARNAALFFRVSGTNKTGGRMVRFVGQLVTNQAPPSQALRNAPQNTLAVEASQSLQIQNASQNFRHVTGEVRVEGAPVFRIEAFEMKE